MEAYGHGTHAYHATMPTDSLARLRDAMKELESFGFEKAKAAQQELGDQVRRMLVDKGMPSVAATGFQAPTVVVSYTDDKDIQSARKFIDVGVQAAAGVPLQCDEPADFRSFRIGLFGLDKLRNVERTVKSLDRALSQLTAEVR
jgi:aspartate aminotransferase-like enzyme